MATNNQNSKETRPRRRRRKSLFGRIVGGFFKTLGTLLLIGLCTGGILACFAVVYVQTIIMPQANEVIDTMSIFDVSQSSTMYYTDKDTGEQLELLNLRGTEDRVWVEYEEIPQNLINATIAIEDKRFRKHPGVDWIRTGYGVLSMLTGQDIQGGSTITQQLIKNVTKYDEVTVKRKILEIFTALEFEKTHSKNDILEWYLNYIYLGDGCNGVYTASLNYFGKELKDLTLAECASLISITQNPSLRNPYRNPEKNLERRNTALEIMASEELGFITQEECDAAKAEPLNLKREVGTYREQEIFTWYEDQVIKDVIMDLMAEYDLTEEAATHLIYHGGLHIETCFDPEVQAYVDAVYTTRDVSQFISKTGKNVQSGMTVVDNSTGNVIALAGGLGEKDGSRVLSRATDTIRAPGSSIKPLAVYAPALDMGLITPATVVDDMPIELYYYASNAAAAEAAGEEYVGDPWPSNSYNYYKGLTTIYEAVEDSVNTIAVRVLQDMVTPQSSYQYLTERFGITTLVASREVNGQVKSDIDRAPLALGGLTDGVSTYEMAAAYATFANNGMYKRPRTYTRVTAIDVNGRETVLLENASSSEAVLKESTVYYINTMLENVVDKGTGRRANFDGMTIAGKTGTTTSNYDKWFVGYTPYYTAAVWVGYDIQERLPNSTYLAQELWKEVMEPLHEGLEDTGFRVPDNIVTQKYCRDSGLIATELCAADPRGNRIMTGTFLQEDQLMGYCTAHVAQKVCLDSPILEEDGSESGMYHIAGEYCPEERCKEISVVDYDRYRAKEGVEARDDDYLKSAWTDLENGGVCDVHVAPPAPFDPLDPTTWPVDDPNFNISDPATWPEQEQEPETPETNFDPFDPTTWPTDDPNFDPLDSRTWPATGTTENQTTNNSSWFDQLLSGWIN